MSETTALVLSLVFSGGGVATLITLYYRFRHEAPKVNVDRQAQIIDDIAAENERLRALVLDALSKDERIAQHTREIAELSVRVNHLEREANSLRERNAALATDKKLLIAQVVEAGLTPIVV